MIAPTQLINVAPRLARDRDRPVGRSGAGRSRATRSVKVSLQPSTWIFWLFANNDPKVSTVTSNKQFQTAVRYALDYKSIVGLAGPGAIQAPGIIPSMFLGSLPQSATVKQDLAKAKAALAASGVGEPAGRRSSTRAT